MPPPRPQPLVTAHRPLAVVLGTNEIASAVGVQLCRTGWGVVLSFDPLPPVLRRGMAFHDALWGDEATIDGVRAIAVDGLLDLLAAVSTEDTVAVTRMGLTDLLPLGAFDLLVDARLHKYAVTPDLRPFAATAIGLGPGFTAGCDCDAAIETRPDRLGLTVTRGSTAAPDHAPPRLGAAGEERFVRAAETGVWRTAFPIGARVFRGQIVGRLGRSAIAAPMDGLLRGLVRDDCEVPQGAKLIEVDPRRRWQARWSGLDERGRIVGAAVGAIAVRDGAHALDRVLSGSIPLHGRRSR